MSDKIISLDNRPGPFQMVFQRVLRMVPDRDRNDPQLRRLLAFRLSVDGEDATRAYLMRTIRGAIQESYTGRLYERMAHDTAPADLPAPISDPLEPA